MAEKTTEVKLENLKLYRCTVVSGGREFTEYYRYWNGIWFDLEHDGLLIFMGGVVTGVYESESEDLSYDTIVQIFRDTGYLEEREIHGV